LKTTKENRTTNEKNHTFLQIFQLPFLYQLHIN